MKKALVLLGVLAMAAGVHAEIPTAISTLVSDVTTLWGTVLTGGVGITAAVLGVAVIKKIRKFF